MTDSASDGLHPQDSTGDPWQDTVASAMAADLSPDTPGTKADQNSRQDGQSEFMASKPSFGRQVAQLVVIPAVIVVLCITMAVLFGKLAGAKDDIDTHLLKLRQSSGAGKLAMGLQDPRYKDRGLAAYNIATMIPKLTDTQERQRVNDALIEILDEHVAPDEEVLQSYLLMAIGQLGQAGGVEAILTRLESDHPQVRQSAIGGLLSWPDAVAARGGIDALAIRLKDKNPVVRSAAAAALGQLAQPGDVEVIVKLQAAMEDSDGLVMREARWNTAVTLAKLNDETGRRFVANILLDRQALSQMPAGETGPLTQQKMTLQMQDRVIMSTLASLGAKVNSSLLWDSVKKIADNDPSRAVRNAARQIVMNQQKHQRS